MTQVEYIEGTGTQWLDTGIKPGTTTVVKAGIMMTAPTGGVIVGHCYSDNSDYRCFNYQRTAYFDYNGSRIQGGQINDATYYDLEMGNYYLKLNGSTVASGTTITSGGDYENHNIVSMYSPMEQTRSQMRLYYLQIINHGVLVFDGVPIKDDNDSACMFDNISRTYIRNSGTGDFVAGPDVPQPSVSKNYIGLARLTEVFGYLKTKLDGKVNKTDIVSKQSAGLVPQLPNETTTTKYLRQDGSWETPPNTYDRNRFQAAVKAGSTALGASNIIVGINGSYHQLNDGTAFDISHPILFLASACSADATTYNSYDIIHVTITTTQAITLTPYIPVFIKGTLSGTTFTPVSATPLTQTIPTTDDGYQYIFLGNATGSVSLYLTEVHDIYEYRDGVFGPMVGSGSTYTEGDGIDISAQNVISVDTTFTEASTRANIDSGDTLATIWGKIKKFFSDLKTVAFSGSYNDLSDRPTIPAAQVNSDWNASSGVAQILNKPTIPSVGNGTLTIQKNGTNVATFTANQSGNATANITVPTKTSQLTNDSGFLTSHQDISGKANAVPAGSGNMNTVAALGNAMGMVSISGTNKNINPNGQTGWHHFINLSYHTESNNMWQTQFAIAAATTNVWVRSRAGGSIADGTAWAANWVRLAKASEVITSISRSGTTFTATRADGTTFTFTQQDNNTTYSANNGVGLSGTTFYNSGVRSIGTGSANGTISVNTNGTSANVSVKGLGSAAYLTADTASSANTVAKRDGSKNLAMNNCNCEAVIVNSDNWLPICGYSAVTIRNRANSAYIQINASVFSVQSSRRYKENIEDMTNEDARQLLDLRVVTFDYIDGIIDGDRTGKKGFIAEEVAEIETFPVTYNQDGEIDGLDYSKFVPQLIKLCQMQQNEIDELKVRIDILERAIATTTQS